MTTLTEPRKRAMGLADERLHAPSHTQPIEVNSPTSEPQQVAAPVAAKPGPMDFRARAHQARLRNAHALRASGKLTSASREFLAIYRAAPHSAEGQNAAEIVAQIAAEHEAAGRVRLAMELYSLLAEQ